MWIHPANEWLYRLAWLLAWVREVCGCKVHVVMECYLGYDPDIVMSLKQAIYFLISSPVCHGKLKLLLLELLSTNNRSPDGYMCTLCNVSH